MRDQINEFVFFVKKTFLFLPVMVFLYALYFYLRHDFSFNSDHMMFWSLFFAGYIIALVVFYFLLKLLLIYLNISFFNSHYVFLKELVVILLSLLLASLVSSLLFFYGYPFKTMENVSFQGLFLNGIESTPVYIISFSSLFLVYYNTNHRNKVENILNKQKYENLKNQMSPHFLFNSLNSLSELIETNEDEANDFIEKLADTYMLFIDNSKFQFVEIKKELILIDKYLGVEKIRMGERLQFKKNIDSDLLSLYIPSCILQTLVENAIKHGISKLRKGGTLELSLLREKKGVQVVIKNSVNLELLHQEDSKKRGCKVGLSNVKERLEILYGKKSSFMAELFEDEFVVSFWVAGENLNHKFH